MCVGGDGISISYMYLDILEVDFSVLTEVDDGAKEIEQSCRNGEREGEGETVSTGNCRSTPKELTFKALERLKEVNEGSCGQLLMVL